jgi:hypothetical protein
MKTKLGALIAGIALLATVVPVLAHHPFDNDFDRNKFVTLTGTVTRVEWTNPHSNLYIEVKDPEGKAMSWTLELGSMDTLMKSGWTRESVKPGDQVTVQAWLAKDGSRRANADSLTLTRKLMAVLISCS